MNNKHTKDIIFAPVEGIVVTPFFGELKRAAVDGAIGKMQRIAAGASYRLGISNKYTNDLLDQISGGLISRTNAGIDANRMALQRLAREYDIVFHSNIGEVYEPLLKDALGYGSMGFGARVMARNPYESAKWHLQTVAGDRPANVWVLDSDIKTLRMAREMSMRPVLISDDWDKIWRVRRDGMMTYKTITDFARANMVRSDGR